MTTALILAGGSGARTEQDIPKQFMNVSDKPIILYTLEVFQNHPEIDAIIVSCLSGWEGILSAYAKEDGIDKLRWIVPGGENGQQSARIALEKLADVCVEEDIVIIHDAVRPLVSADIISDCIAVCKMYGSGLAAVRCQETIMKTENGINGRVGINRQDIMRVQTPQAYEFKKALHAHTEALERGIINAVYTNTLMLDLDYTLYFSKGSEKNIKITTLEDIEIFKALYNSQKDDWMK